jgi:opacity protein-like surface antigen
MKKLMLLAVLGMFAVSPAFADKGDFWFGLNAGVSGPTGDFSDFADMGWQGTATGTYMLTPALGLGADLGYHSWGGSDDYDAFLQFISGDPAAEGSFTAIQGTGHLTFMIPMEGKARPYLQGGLGVYNVKAKVETSTDDVDDSSSDFGFNLGGGVNFLVSPMYMVGLGAAYHSIQTEDTSTDFYTVGVNLLWGKGK